MLEPLRSGLARILGAQLDRVLLFGSQARGEAHPDSDIDVLVVIRGPVDYADLMRRTSALVSGLSLEEGVVISRVFVSREQFEHGQTPFLRNVRREFAPL